MDSEVPLEEENQSHFRPRWINFGTGASPTFGPTAKKEKKEQGKYGGKKPDQSFLFGWALCVELTFLERFYSHVGVCSSLLKF